MQRDILFLLSGLPEDRMFGDANYFFANPDPTLKDLFAESAKQAPSLADFLKKVAAVRCFGIRTNEYDPIDAIESGFHVLSGMLDGISLAFEAEPAVCPVVFVREGDSTDLVLHVFVGGGGWATFQGSDKFQKDWATRSAAIYDRVLKFADMVNDSVPRNEITDQIQCSTKMFRHGRESRVFGIQFLAKFSAVEGLVCGPERNGHGRLLRTRISCLFRSTPKADEIIGELWEYRCSASHQARAFERFGGALLPAHVPALDFFFLGLFTFAVDHCPQVSVFSDLWPKASAYSLPAEVLLERPDDAPRYAIRRGHMHTHLTITNNGRLFDQFFK